MTQKSLAKIMGITLIIMPCNPGISQDYQTRDKKDQGYESLFDGKSTEGWRGYQMDHVPGKWVVEEGTLHFNPRGKGDGGTLIYDKIFANFHLKLEWKISRKGNSGIFYLGSENEAYHEIYESCPEMQVLDNERHPDAKKGRDGNRKAGSLYDLIPADPQYCKAVGEWNLVEVIHKDGHVIHKMNGETVVEYQVGTPEWKELVAISKFPPYNPNWADLNKEGYIGLQDHGDKVWFRNIQIKEL